MSMFAQNVEPKKTRRRKEGIAAAFGGGIRRVTEDDMLAKPKRNQVEIE